MAWLSNQFLIAMPSMKDPHFEKTVTLICQHSKDGALGIVVNRATDLHLKDIYEQLELDHNDAPEVQLPVHYGGPVQSQRGLILHDSGEDFSSIRVGTTLGLTTSRDVLEAISFQQGPRNCMAVLGFAGWESGQLEEEMRQNVWLSVQADTSIIFDTPIERRWQRAAALVGVDFSTLSTEIGHA